MIISNNTLLNILLPNDNKALKEVLKNADEKTIESFKNGTTSVSDILKNLFDDLKSADKNKANIENILKNTNLFKDLGNFSKSLTNLLNQIESDENFSNYKPLIQNFLKDITNIDHKSLKDLINKSGVFLESKALEEAKTQTALPKDLENILKQIKAVVKGIPTLEAKKIENLIDKILQNNPKNINQTLTLNTQTQSDLKTLISTLQDFSKNIADKQLTNLSTLLNSLKNISSEAQLVESKITNANTVSSDVNQHNVKQNISPKTLDILTQIKNELSASKTIPDVKTMIKQIDNIIQTNNLPNNNSQLEVKNLINQLINSSEIKMATKVEPTINTLINNLSLQDDVTDLQQVKQNISPKTLDILTQVKNELSANKTIPDVKTMIKQIDNIIQTNNLPNNNSQLEVKNSINQLINSSEIKMAAKIEPTINTLINNLSLQDDVTDLQQIKQNISTKTTDILVQLKNELISNKNIPNSTNILKQIDTLLQSNNFFSNNNLQIEPKNLLNQLVNLNEIKTASTLDSNISTLINQLKTQTNSIETIENKLFQNLNISNEKTTLTNEIKQTLTSLKTELQSVKSIDTNMINQIMDKLLNTQNLFMKIDLPLDMKNLQQLLLNQTIEPNSFKSNFEANINNLVLNLKESIVNLSGDKNNLNLQQNIIKTVEKLETVLNTIIQNTNLPLEKQTPQASLQNDMKAVLLQIQNDLVTKTDTSSQELLKQVDKMIMQVEYHQLLSIVSNSNSIYVPFIWDMLDDGSISIKKGDEEKFYCEINLSLKEFGQTQLLLAIYDKNKLDLTIYASQEKFKQKIRENSSKLKQALNSADLIPVNIKIVEMKKETDSKENKFTNTYTQNNSLDFGVDIRV